MRRLFLAYLGFIAAFLAFGAVIVLALSIAVPSHGQDFVHFKKKAAAGGGGYETIDLTLQYATTAYGSRDNTSVTAPTGTTSGDFLLASLYIESDTAVSATGWTLIVRLNHSSSVMNQYVYYRRATGSGDNFATTHSSAATEGYVKRITGVVATGDPEDCTRSTAEGVDNVTAGSITTATDGAALVMLASNYQGGAWSSSDITERIDITGQSWLGADVQATAGASGTKTADSVNGTNYCATLIALKPNPL